jgi:hypothetical protein
MQNEKRTEKLRNKNAVGVAWLIWLLILGALWNDVSVRNWAYSFFADTDIKGMGNSVIKQWWFGFN